MDPIDNPSPVDSDLSQLQAQHESLRQLVHSILVLLVIVSGTLTIYLFRQYRFVHQEVANFEPQYANIISQYAQLQPKMEDFERRITEFARTHPDFAAQLSKYGARQAPTAGTPAKAPAPGHK